MQFECYYSNRAVTLAYAQFFGASNIEELDAILTQLYFGSKAA